MHFYLISRNVFKIHASPPPQVPVTLSWRGHNKIRYVLGFQLSRSVRSPPMLTCPSSRASAVSSSEPSDDTFPVLTSSSESSELKYVNLLPKYMLTVYKLPDLPESEHRIQNIVKPKQNWCITNLLYAKTELKITKTVST